MPRLSGPSLAALPARRFSTAIPLLVVLGLAVAPARAQAGPRPILITVDDLPISAGRLHPDPEERLAVTRGMLAALKSHGIQAVGLVTWGNVRDEADLRLLSLWLEAGHELGNHSWGHLDYSATETDAFVADIESAREALAGFLATRGKPLRFFRFPFLREGDDRAKLDAARGYLERTGQRNLPVTIDNQDWSFERPWVEAAGDDAARQAVAEDYHAALRIAVRHHERRGDRLLGRPLPQILLLHATAIGAAQWDRLFTWLEDAGHRFAGADEVLADPVFEKPHDFVGPKGFGLWDRLAVAIDAGNAREAIERVLRNQAAAWSRGDLEAFCAAYAEDAFYISPTGEARGREALAARYRARYPDASAMGSLRFEIVEFRPAAGYEVSLLGDAVPASIHGVSVMARWTLSYPGRTDATGMTLLVFHPGATGWQIVHDASF